MSKAGSTLVAIILSGTSTPRLRLPRLVDNSSIGDADPDLTAPSILPKSKVCDFAFWGAPGLFQVSFSFSMHIGHGTDDGERARHGSFLLRARRIHQRAPFEGPYRPNVDVVMYHETRPALLCQEIQLLLIIHQGIILSLGYRRLQSTYPCFQQTR